MQGNSLEPVGGPALYLLGGVSLTGVPGDSEAVVRQSKVVALLACLALAPSGTFIRRDRVVGLLWPDLDQTHARAALRKTVHCARGVLGEDAIVGRGDEELALASSLLWVDAVDLLASIERGRLARAVELYRGDLMPGFFLSDCNEFDSWLEEQRTSLRDAAVAACWSLAQHLETGNHGTDASKYAKKVTRLDKANERLLRRAMQMLDRLGDRAGALTIYDEFRRRLMKDLEAEPSPETVKLADALRSGRPIA
jgi:DNA-binding SARP family transcriptional activator